MGDARIPAVLADPPWRRAPPPPSRRPVVVAPPREGARVEWREGERERFCGPAVRHLSGDADETLLERLLDQVDRGRPLPVPELSRLSDERLAELAEDLPESAVDVGGMRLLLGRLADAFAPRAVALVRGSPMERGLFAAVAPVRAAELARVAAGLMVARGTPGADALARPFAPSDAEAWLERFPDTAAAGLIAPALDESDVGHRGARVALAWIVARGGVEHVRAAIGRAGDIAAPLEAWIEPFASLAALRDREGLGWLALLAVVGLDAEALTLLAPHGDVAAVPWVTRALAGPARAAATVWLEQHREVAEPVVRARARGAGQIADEAGIAVAVLGGDATAGDPALDDVPTAIPPLPGFFRPEALPVPRLRDGSPLPPDAVRALGEMLRFSPLLRPYAGVAQVRAACDPASLDQLAAALLEAWIATGEEPLERWALDACGKIGGDVCAREVARRARGWAHGAQPQQRGWDEDERSVVVVAEGDRGWSHARAACLVLAAIGSDLALTLLDDLARGATQAWLRREASRTLETVLEGRRLRRAQLEDEMVPDLGLDADGSATLDLGARRYRLAFDEMLVPHLVDEAGARLRTFPRPRRDDDADKAAEAKRRFQAVGRDAKVLARQQIAQLEAAMCSQRVWSLQAFRERFVAHPALRHLARRLVWALEDLSTTFRVAEDLSFADAADKAFSPSSSCSVVVVHPVVLTDDVRARWTELFADYELLQPFPQLGRELFEPLESERGATHVARVAGARTTRGRIFGLARRGWSARPIGAVVVEWVRELPGGADARFAISPAMTMGEGAGDEEFTVTVASCSMSLDKLSRVDCSELLRDLDYLRR